MVAELYAAYFLICMDLCNWRSWFTLRYVGNDKLSGSEGSVDKSGEVTTYGVTVPIAIGTRCISGWRVCAVSDFERHLALR